MLIYVDLLADLCTHYEHHIISSYNPKDKRDIAAFWNLSAGVTVGQCHFIKKKKENNFFIILS